MPSRPQTKEKDERGVGDVKRGGIAGRLPLGVQRRQRRAVGTARGGQDGPGSGVGARGRGPWLQRAVHHGDGAARLPAQGPATGDAGGAAGRRTGCGDAGGRSAPDKAGFGAHGGMARFRDPKPSWLPTRLMT
jgi:hypothetical protein